MFEKAFFLYIKPFFWHTSEAVEEVSCKPLLSFIAFEESQERKE